MLVVLVVVVGGGSRALRAVPCRVCALCPACRRRYALKVISKLKFKNERDKLAVKEEAAMMHRLRGFVHVAGLYGHLEDSVAVFLVMECCTGGDMMKYVTQVWPLRAPRVPRVYACACACVYPCGCGGSWIDVCVCARADERRGAVSQSLCAALCSASTSRRRSRRACLSRCSWALSTAMTT